MTEEVTSEGLPEASSASRANLGFYGINPDEDPEVGVPLRFTGLDREVADLPNNLSVDFDGLLEKRSQLRAALPYYPENELSEQVMAIDALREESLKSVAGETAEDAKIRREAERVERLKMRKDAEKRATSKMAMQILAETTSLEPDQAKEKYEAAEKRIWEETAYTQNLSRAVILGHAIDSFVQNRRGPDQNHSPQDINFQNAVNAVYTDGTPPSHDKFLLTLGSRAVLPKPAEDVKKKMTETYPDNQNNNGVSDGLMLLLASKGYMIGADDENVTLAPILRTRGSRPGMIPTRPKAFNEEFARLNTRLNPMNQDTIPEKTGWLTTESEGVGAKSVVDVLVERTAGPNAIEAKSSMAFVNEYIKANPSVDPEKLVYTVNAVDQLQALGYPETTICEILKDPGKWIGGHRELGKVFASVQGIIDSRAANLGLDELGVAGMVDAHRLRQQNERLKVMGIVQDELIDAQGD